MKWLWLLLLVVPLAAAEWIPVETEISFEAEVSGGVERGHYEVVVENGHAVPLKTSMGLNFESIPSELEVTGYEIDTGYEGAEGAQYFVYFDLGPGEVKRVEMDYVRRTYPAENFFEWEYSYNSPVKLIFDAGDGETYYEVASYSGGLVVDKVDFVKCRRCLQDGNRIYVEDGKDFSVQWSAQKVPLGPAVVYSVFIGFAFALIVWELHKWMLGGQGSRP